MIDQKALDALASVIYLARQQVADVVGNDDDKRIRASGLFNEWVAGAHTVGDICNANDQTWECFQAHDNAVYPDINPDNSAWFTFWRPLHGKTPETARPWVAPTGAHDIYKAGEYMIWSDGVVYKCLSGTNFSPADYAPAWEAVG